MKLERHGQTADAVASERGFVGDVRIAGYFRRGTPSRLAGATVSFAPGARTPWKTNPLGQTLVVLTGRGLIGDAEGTVVEIEAGDIIWWPPGERHWEGAAPDAPLTYVAVQEEEVAATVTFGDAVTDAEYRGRASTTI